MTTPTTAPSTLLMTTRLTFDDEGDDGDGEDGDTTDGTALPEPLGAGVFVSASVGGTITGETDGNGVGIGVVIDIEESTGEGPGIGTEDGSGEGA